MAHISKFGKQESLESSQESWNQAKIPQRLELHWRKSVVADPSVYTGFLVFDTVTNSVSGQLPNSTNYQAVCITVKTLCVKISEGCIKSIIGYVSQF